MGSGLKFLEKRGKPRTTKKGKNKAQSVARRPKDSHVTRALLDAALAPTFSVFKKDYGVNIVTDDALCNGTEHAASGNLPSFQCLPGRQCYMEFNALPFRPMDMRADIAATPAWVASTVVRPYSFVELLFNAWKRGKSFRQTDSAVAAAMAVEAGKTLQSQTTGIGADTLAQFELGMRFGSTNSAFVDPITVGEGSDMAASKAFVDSVFDKALFNFKYAYNGGYQEHTWVNTTTLPVHGEIIEYCPRQVMPYCIINRLAAGSTTAYDAGKIPGMYMTLSRDQMRKNTNHNYDTTTNLLTNYDSTGLYDEIDDKGFKYDSGCADTNFLWKVGKKVRFTIYPGCKYVYKMILPPFSGNSLEFANGMKRRFALAPGASGQYIDAFNVCLVPGFSKGCSVRFWGSPAYKRPGGTVHTPQVDTYVANNMIGLSEADNAMKPNPSVPFGAHTSHGVRMTHQCVEYHRMRVFPTFDKGQLLKLDRTSNAANKADITVSDNMANIDLLENQEENVAGNHV